MIGDAHSGGRTRWALLLAAVLLSVLTFVSMKYMDRFGIETEQLLQDDTFSDSATSWQQSSPAVVDYGDGQVIIRNNPGASQKVSQNVEVETPAFYRFSYAAEVNDVVPTSPEHWALASVAIIYRDQSGERVGSKMITTLSGTEPSKHFTEDLLLTESIASIDFAVRLYRASGEFIVSEPVMSRLQELSAFKGVRYSIVAAWVVLSGFIAYIAIRFFRAWQLFLLSAMAALALVGTMMPEATMTALTQRMAGMLPEPFLLGLRELLSNIYGEGRFTDAGTEVSKLGHFLIFTCFGIFAGSMWKRCGVYYAIGAIVVFALATEALQTLVYGRTTNVGDLIVDGAGGMLGLIVGIVLAVVIGLFKKAQTSGSEVEADYDEELSMSYYEDRSDNYYEEDRFDESNRYRN